MNPWLIIAAIGVVIIVAAGAGWQGYRMGFAASEARYNLERLAMIEAGHKLDQARRLIAQQRDDLADELEAKGNAEPVSVTRCLGISRVRRLNTQR